MMEQFSPIFEGVNDPRKSNATRHDLQEMLMIGLLCVLCGGEGCCDMALFGRSKQRFLRRFMTLGHGIPGHDAFSGRRRSSNQEHAQPCRYKLSPVWRTPLHRKKFRPILARSTPRSGLPILRS